jgi:hypothetical protein
VEATRFASGDRLDHGNRMMTLEEGFDDLDAPSAYTALECVACPVTSIWLNVRPLTASLFSEGFQVLNE